MAISHLIIDQHREDLGSPATARFWDSVRWSPVADSIIAVFAHVTADHQQLVFQWSIDGGSLTWTELFTPLENNRQPGDVSVSVAGWWARVPATPPNNMRVRVEAFNAPRSAAWITDVIEIQGAAPTDTPRGEAFFIDHGVPARTIGMSDSQHWALSICVADPGDSIAVRQVDVQQTDANPASEKPADAVGPNLAFEPDPAGGYPRALVSTIEVVAT